MSLTEKRASIVKTLKEKQAILKKADESGTPVSDDDIQAVKDLLASLDAVNADIEKAQEQAKLVSKISALSDTDSTDTGNDAPANMDDTADDANADSAKAVNPGRVFVKSYEKQTGLNVLSKSHPFAMEVKAATDTQTEGAFGPVLTQVDRNPVFPYQRPLTVAALFGQGTLGANNNAVEYPVFGALEGAPKTVAEAGAKSQFHFADPTWTTDTLKEVAGWFAVSDNMLEDLDWLQSEINNYAATRLQLVEEDQLLSGDGTGSNLKGILNRDIQKLLADSHTDADRIFETRRLISNATGFAPDGVVINPADYEAIRLSRDSNGQYFGGGYFTGAYGNGGLLQDPPIWGMRTVVTEAIPQGTALVGAFAAGGKVFRKGGLRIESSNSHGDDFINDRVTIRLRERLALQVEYPKAFVAVTLGGASASSPASHSK